MEKETEKVILQTIEEYLNVYSESVHTRTYYIYIYIFIVLFFPLLYTFEFFIIKIWEKYAGLMSVPAYWGFKTNVIQISFEIFNR